MTKLWLNGPLKWDEPISSLALRSVRCTHLTVSAVGDTWLYRERGHMIPRIVSPSSPGSFASPPSPEGTLGTPNGGSSCWSVPRDSYAFLGLAGLRAEEGTVWGRVAAESHSWEAFSGTAGRWHTRPTASGRSPTK